MAKSSKHSGATGPSGPSASKRATSGTFRAQDEVETRGHSDVAPKPESKSHSDVAPKPESKSHSTPNSEAVPPADPNTEHAATEPSSAERRYSEWVQKHPEGSVATFSVRPSAPHSLRSNAGGNQALPAWTDPISRDSEAPVSSVWPSFRYGQSEAGPPPTDRRLHPIDAALLQVLHSSFSEHAGPDSRLDAAELQRALQIDDAFLAERVLTVLDQDGDGIVTRAEFLDRVRRLVFGPPKDKLRFAFRIHDLNGDNVIERHELLRMITVCMAEERTLDSPRAAEQLTDLLLEDADENRDGRLSYSEFEAVVARHPQVLELITRSEARWIAPNEDLLQHFEERRSQGRRLRRALQNRTRALVVVALWTLINIALFTHAVLRYHEAGANGFVMLARGCGACLNFNGALILVPVMRRLLTRVRRSRALSWLPVDDAIAFHRLLGHSMFALALVHTLAHLGNYHFAAQGVAAGLTTTAGWTGLCLMLVFGWMWFCSRPTLRRSGKFELFYFSHLLYLAWFALCLAHGPVFYLWAGLPLLGFVVEQVLRKLRRARRTAVVSAEPLPSGVTRLEIARPDNFRHQAGDYAFLRIPELARFEWHPFTISSAPEQKHLTMHIRSLGNFTTALRRLVERRQREASSQPLEAYVDGPYGTASAHIFEAKHAVLIGAGIGVTPFASVLESIVLRAQAGTTSLEKVYFYWLNRDAYSFEWFAALLAQLEEQDPEQLVEIHIHMTGGRGHLPAAALNLAREISHQKGRRDLITGLRSKTEMGPPDWYGELERIANRHGAETVEVFFCGPPGLGRSVRQICQTLGLHFRQEHF